MGKHAVDLLVSLIEGKQPDPIENVLPCRLDVRESTAKPRNQAR
jgi:DNA-binding LacI/PurR family transcriptional regulator